MSINLNEKEGERNEKKKKPHMKLATCSIDTNSGTYHIVSSIMAFTISFWLFFNAFIAFERLTFACVITNSISFSSTPVSSTSSSDSSAIGATDVVVLLAAPSAAVSLNFSAAATWACCDRSSILASPNTM